MPKSRVSVDSTANKTTIHFISLGCPKNRVDTEVMLGVSGVRSFRHVSDPNDAEVIVVNTCGFIGEAKEESIDTILEMSARKEAGTCKTLVVSGCLSQRYPEELALEMPEVDHFLGTSDMLKLGQVLDGVLGQTKPQRMLVGNPADYTQRASDPRILSLSAHSAYVKIAEGCNRTCSFCAIPSFRGKQRSRSIDDIVAECANLIAQGCVELNLISQDTISFGRDRKGLAKSSERDDLPELIRRVADLPGANWVRVFYLYPETLKPELLELFAQHPKVLPYIDMPLQHASDAMLKRMKRGHGIDRQKRCVETLKNAIPNLVFRTAFIVGHPGESEADFDELTAFMRWAEFDRVGVFGFSPEETTPSATMDEVVPEKVRNARVRKLNALQRQIARKKQKNLVGREVDVLVEGESAEHEYLLEGRWWGQAPEIDGKVYLANGTAKRGELRRALVTQATDYDLVADLADAKGALPDRPPGEKTVRRKEALHLKVVS